MLAIKNEQQVPIFHWNRVWHCNLAPSCVIGVTGNTELGDLTCIDAWTELPRIIVAVDKRSSNLFLISSRLILDGIYGRLQPNRIIEFITYTHGRYRSYIANKIVLLSEDSRDEFIIVDWNPVSSDLLVRLTFYLHSWLRGYVPMFLQASITSRAGR